MAAGAPARRDGADLRVLVVAPLGTSVHSMVFAERVVLALRTSGVTADLYRLRSRTRPASLLGDTAGFRRAVRDFRAQVVHAHYGSVTAAFCTLASPVPVVITYCGSDLNPCPSMLWLRSLAGRALSQVAALGADSLICVSEELRSRLLWKRSSAIVLPNPVDLRAFRPIPQGEARTRVGWPGDRQVILFNAGKSPRVKRLDIAERVFSLVRERVPEAQLHVLSGDTDPAAIPDLMNASDCLLMASDYEGSPNVVKEAVAVGLPVVSVPVGDVAAVLEGVAPSYVVPRDVGCLADAVINVLRSGTRSNGPSVAQRFSLEVQGAALRELYGTVLRKGHAALPGEIRCESGS